MNKTITNTDLVSSDATLGTHDPVVLRSKHALDDYPVLAAIACRKGRIAAVVDTHTRVIADGAFDFIEILHTQQGQRLQMGALLLACGKNM